MEPVDAERLLSIFGAADPGFVNLMLSGVINASCDKRTLEAGEVTLGAAFVLAGADVARRFFGVELVVARLEREDAGFGLLAEALQVGAVFGDGQR